MPFTIGVRIVSVHELGLLCLFDECKKRGIIYGHRDYLLLPVAFVEVLNVLSAPFFKIRQIFKEPCKIVLLSVL